MVLVYGEYPKQNWKNTTVTTPSDMSGYTAAGITVETVERGVMQPPTPDTGNLVPQTTVTYRAETDPGPGLNIYQKTTTQAYFRKAEGGSGGGGGTGGGVGMDRSNPSITITCQTVQRSILEHPKVKPTMDEGGNAARALKALSQGASEQDYVGLPGKQVQIASVATGKAFELVQKSSTYLDITVTAQASYQVQQASITTSDVTVAIKSPPFAAGTPKGRNWLYTGTTYQKQGTTILCTETYMLSDAGGWDKDIYG